MTNFCGVAKSSVMDQLPTSTGLPVGLWSSIVSFCGGTEADSNSLMSTGAMEGNGGSSKLGAAIPARHWLRLLHASGSAFSFTTTSEKPCPSVIGYQELL